MEFRILGPLEVVEEQNHVPLGPEKQRAVLALLLLGAGHAVAVDRLIDGLWGDEPPESPVKAIQTYVSRLRKVLPGNRLCTRPPATPSTSSPASSTSSASSSCSTRDGER